MLVYKQKSWGMRAATATRIPHKKPAYFKETNGKLRDAIRGCLAEGITEPKMIAEELGIKYARVVHMLCRMRKEDSLRG